MSRNLNKRNWSFPLLLALFSILAGHAQSLNADTIVVDAIGHGWYKADGTAHGLLTPHIPRQFGNYIVGRGGGSAVEATSEHRNFFVFPIPEIRGPITSASLHIGNPRFGYTSPDPSETVAFFDVLTEVDDLVQGETGLIPNFDDLGEGSQFGSVVVRSTDIDKFIDLELNAAARTSIRSAVGGSWAIGGRLTTLGTARFETVFGNTPETGLRPYLSLQVLPIPEPNGLVLLVVSALLLWNARRI
jgi:hypothetical protein